MVDYSEAAETIWAYANGSWFHDGAAGVPYVRSDIAERLSAELAEARKLLEFYADPLDFVTRNNLDEETPDFYDELDTGWRARAFLASKEASHAE